MYQKTPIITSFPEANISTAKIEIIGGKTNNNTLTIVLAVIAIGAIAIGLYLGNKSNKEATVNIEE